MDSQKIAVPKPIEAHISATPYVLYRINNLQAQPQDTREMTQTLAEPQQRGQEASQALAQESLGAYMNFINSMFSYCQAAPEAQKG